MYRDTGIDRNYEDAIPVKRSRRSERVRSEARREATKSRGTVDFSLNRKDVPTATADRDDPERISCAVQTATRTIPSKEQAESETQAKSNPVPKPTRVGKPTPVTKPAVSAQPVSDDDININVPETETEATGSVLDPIILPEIPDEETRRNAPSVDLNMRVISREERDTDAPEKKHKKQGLTVGKVIGRTLLSLFTALILLVGAVFAACYTVAVGPSETVRNILVLSAMQASATKWVPGLFLDDTVVDQIVADSEKVNTDVISVDDYQDQQNEQITEDKWANAIDGMIFETVNGSTFKGYVLLIRDPSRVSVGVAATEFTKDTEGLRIFDMAEKYGSVAAINGGEYPDSGGMGIGGRPIGLTYSDGECVWNDNLQRSFMGFDKDNRLIVREGLTKAEADELGIRDGVCFQTGKTLITNEDGNVTMYYADNNTGTAQRTAIGQTADGTVILLVTDGRTASSLGATHNDVIDVMVSYGAVSAGMLDGGSSSLMYYKDYFDKYGIDKSGLDEYQQMGLVNKYKAFTTPRRLPTCFIVAPE